MSKLKIDFVIAGAQKAGSTFLLETIRSHPQIFMPRTELAYFEASLFSPERLDSFANHFHDASPSQVLGFKRPNLLGCPKAPENIKEVLGATKIVLVLRNPVDRAISAYYHYMATGILPCVQIDKGFETLFDLESCKPDRHRDILEFGNYGKHVERYGQVFGFQNLCIVQTSDLKSPERPLSKVFSFIGVPTNQAKPQTDRRPMAAPYSMPRILLRRAMEEPAKKWDSGHQYFDFKAGLFWSPYLKAARQIDQKVLSTLFRSAKPKSPELRERLTRYYAEDQKRLNKLVPKTFGQPASLQS